MGNILIVPNSDFSENCIDIPTITVKTINGLGWRMNFNAGWEVSQADAQGNVPAQTTPSNLCFVLTTVDENHPYESIVFPDGTCDMTGVLEHFTYYNSLFMFGSRCGNGSWPDGWALLDSPDNINIETWSCNEAFGRYFKECMSSLKITPYLFKNLYNCTYLDCRGLLPWLNTLTNWPILFHQINNAFIDISGYSAPDTVNFSVPNETIMVPKGVIVNDVDNDSINKLLTQIQRSEFTSDWDVHTSSKYGKILSSKDYI